MAAISRIVCAVGLAIAGALTSPAPAQTNPSIAARLQHLEDREEIRTVLLDYGRTLDAHDFAAYARLFATDGEWVGGFGSVRGPSAIQTFMEKNIGSGSKVGSTYHLLSNFEIELHGETATAWSRWAYVVTGPDKRPVIAQGGHYDDALVRENGHWKFQRRVAVADIANFGPAAQKNK